MSEQLILAYACACACACAAQFTVTVVVAIYFALLLLLLAFFAFSSISFSSILNFFFSRALLNFFCFCVQGTVFFWENHFSFTTLSRPAIVYGAAAASTYLCAFLCLCVANMHWHFLFGRCTDFNICEVVGPLPLCRLIKCIHIQIHAHLYTHTHFAHTTFSFSWILRMYTLCSTHTHTRRSISTDWLCRSPLLHLVFLWVCLNTMQ